MSVDKLVDSTQLDADLTSVANAIRTKGGTSASLAFPADFVSAIAAIPSGGGAKTATGTFTGDGTRSATIACTFEPDLIYVIGDLSSDPANIGIGWFVIVRDCASALQYDNNSGSSNLSNGWISGKVTGMNSNAGSNYAYKASYSNGIVTLSAATSGARMVLTSGVSYSYFFVKYTA